MAINKTYSIKRFLLTAGAFVTVKAPIDCNFIVLRNAGDVPVILSTDANDPESYDELASGVQQVIGMMKIVGYISQPFPGLISPVRFNAGSAVVLIKAEQAGADVRVQFVI